MYISDQLSINWSEISSLVKIIWIGLLDCCVTRLVNHSWLRCHEDHPVPFKSGSTSWNGSKYAQLFLKVSCLFEQPYWIAFNFCNMLTFFLFFKGASYKPYFHPPSWRRLSNIIWPLWGWQVSCSVLWSRSPLSLQPLSEGGEETVAERV